MQVISRIPHTRAKLQRLDLAHCRRISSEGVMVLADGLSQLTRLSLEGCYHVDNTSVKRLVHRYGQ